VDEERVDEERVDEERVDEERVDEERVDEECVDEECVDEECVDEECVDEECVDEECVDEECVDEECVDEEERVESPAGSTIAIVMVMFTMVTANLRMAKDQQRACTIVTSTPQMNIRLRVRDASPTQRVKVAAAPMSRLNIGFSIMGDAAYVPVHV
jgi:hypothetical protein